MCGFQKIYDPCGGRENSGHEPAKNQVTNKGGQNSGRCLGASHTANSI